MIDPKKAKLTHDLLVAISRRMSSRPEYSKTQYSITIENDSIHVSPIMYVFPDCKHRKDSDKQIITEYILKKNFPELLPDGSTVNDSVGVKPDELLPGNYLYKLYPSAHRRRWVKIS